MNELIEKRTRNSKTHSLGGGKHSWDGSIGAIHYQDSGWQDIDSYFETAVAPWDWEMLKAGYHIRVKEDFTAGQIIEFEKQGETVQFQPMALEWTNDLDQVQQVSMPHEVIPTITNPEVDLLPAVGMPSHQGTIKWNNAYGTGLDFEWKCTSTRLVKILEIENFNKLPTPEQYIIDGGNPVLRLNLIFDPSSGCDIYMDGEKWDKKEKKQTFKAIEFRKDGEVLWGFMPLRYWGSGEGEDNEGQSVATLEKRGNKLYISIRVPYDWLQSATYPVFIDTDVDEQVGASTDDCLEILSDSWWSLDASGLVAGYYSDEYKEYGGGMRFTTINIVQGATITTAYLTLQCKTSYSATSVNTRISAEDIDDAPTFADDIDAFNTRWANRTTARVDWDNIPAWTAGYNYNSAEIKTVVQEIVNRGGWSSGNDIVIFWEDFEDRSSHTTNCFRWAKPYDYSAADAPKLHIEYSVGAGWKGSRGFIIG